jgi:anti-sigma B factor antagonist
MTSDTDTGSNPAVLRIVGELTIFRASELKLALVGAPAPTEVDLAGVTEIDSAGVQLLMLAKKTALKHQRDFRLVAHSEAVMEVFELLDVASYFNDPLVMAARSDRTFGAPFNTSSARHTHGS